MQANIYQPLFILELAIFLAAVLMNVLRRNSSLIPIYTIQSLAVTAILVIPAWQNSESSLYLVAILTFVVKVVLAPTFFTRFTDNNELKLSVSTYLSNPMTLGTILLLIILSNSELFDPIVNLSLQSQQFVHLSIATLLISLFMIINRKGVLSQIIGILSFENGIVATSSLIGLEQLPVLELGIIFDIMLWIVIATIFVALIYKRFGSLDASGLRDLKE